MLLVRDDLENVALAVVFNDLPRRADCNELALMHDGKLAADDLSFVNISRGHQETTALCPCFDRFHELELVGGVDTSERIVKNDEGRPTNQGHAQGKHSRLATCQFFRFYIFEIIKAASFDDCFNLAVSVFV